MRRSTMKKLKTISRSVKAGKDLTNRNGDSFGWSSIRPLKKQKEGLRNRSPFRVGQGRGQQAERDVKKTRSKTRKKDGKGGGG